jgi:hypothetical protein
MRRRWWLLVGVVVISMGMTVLPAGAQLPAPPVSTPPVPSVPTPTVPPVPSTPTVPAPSVPVPTPSAPAPTPSVTVPSVTVPSVSTPSTGSSGSSGASVPSVSTPSVSTPTVSTPSVGGGSGGSGGSGSGGSGSGGSGSGGSGSGSSGSTRAASGSSSSGSSGTSGGGSGGGGGTGAAGSTPGGSASSGGGATGSEGESGRDRSPRTRAQRRAARVQRRERALRRDVLRLQGCLASVPRSERRVLALRAGVGRARPHTRTEVARITHLKRKRVVTLERRGLRRLRALGRAGACGVPTGSTTTAAVMAPGMGTAQPPTGPSGDRSSVLAERHSSGSSKEGGSAEGQRKPPSAQLSISRPSAPGGDDFDLALVLAPLAILAFLLVITREVRRAG